MGHTGQKKCWFRLDWCATGDGSSNQLRTSLLTHLCVIRSRRVNVEVQWKINTPRWNLMFCSTGKTTLTAYSYIDNFKAHGEEYSVNTILMKNMLNHLFSSGKWHEWDYCSPLDFTTSRWIWYPIHQHVHSVRVHFQAPDHNCILDFDTSESTPLDVTISQWAFHYDV